MANIFIVRHGNTFDKGDAVTRVGGRTDLALSQSGHDQALALGEHFREVSFDAAFCSILRRTRETARAILSKTDDDAALLIAPFLIEVDYGPDENRPEEEVVARIGQASMDAWDKEAIPPEGWIVDPEGLRVSWKGLLTRAALLTDDSNILIVTSNGIARFLPDVVDAHTPSIDRKLKTGAYGTVQVRPDGHSEIVNWNIRP